MAVTVARAIPSKSEAIASLYKNIYSGKYPLLDFTDSKLISSMILDKRYIWYIAYTGADQSEVVGSSVGVVETWNNSCELGKTVVDQRYCLQGVAKQLAEAVREEALSTGVEILFGYLRNKAIYEISKNDGLSLVGYFPGAHIVEDREIHLLGLRLSQDAKKKRVTPKVKDIYKLEGINRIITEIDLKDSDGEYPPKIIVSPLEKNVTLDGNYHVQDRSLIVTSAEQLIAPEYIQATVLVDKMKFINAALEKGFVMSAFLPGWYLSEGKRYDCVLLTKSLIEPKLRDRLLEPILTELINGFANVN